MDNFTNNDFLSDLFTEEPIASAATMAHMTRKQPADPNLVERAVLLFSQNGWTYKPASDTEALFLVRSPEGQTVIVFLAEEDAGSFCSCSDFMADKTCVHLLAMEQELAFLAWVDAEEQLHEDGEHPVYGTDPHMHYDRAGDIPC